MHLTRISAGMSPGFRLPTREWMKTPSQTSTAILHRYSWERCMGLRSCRAAISFHPRSSKILRDSAGRM